MNINSFRGVKSNKLSYDVAGNDTDKTFEDNSEIKTKIKRLAQRIIPNTKEPILVSSFGRAGSTLVYNALVDAVAKDRFLFSTRLSRAVCHDTAWDISSKRLLNGVVYKTHDYPAGLAEKIPAKSVFLFGSAIESSLSVYLMGQLKGPGWVEDHMKHLKSTGNSEDILERDTLGFVPQAKAWFGFVDAPVLCLRYETLWSNIDILSDFCEQKVVLPAQRERAHKNFPPDLLEKAQKLYGPLEEGIRGLPDAFIAEPKYSRIISEIGL